MKIAIPSPGSTLSAPMSLRFSRCAFFLLVDTDSGQTEALANPALGLVADAGIQAARFVIEHNAEAVIAVMIGQYAQQVLDDAGVSIYEPELPSGQQILENFRLGRLSLRTAPLNRDEG